MSIVEITSCEVLNDKLITDRVVLLLATSDSHIGKWIMDLGGKVNDFEILETMGVKNNNLTIKIFNKEYTLPCNNQDGLRMMIYSPTHTRNAKWGGWYPIGEAMCDGVFKSHRVQLEYDWEKPKVTAKFKVFQSTFTPPQIISKTESKFAGEELEYEQGLRYFFPRLSRVHQQFIASQSGYIPRDLFYIDEERITTDGFLRALLKRGGWDEKSNLKDQICQVILSVTSWITTECDYQPDFIQLKGGGQLDVENFDKCGVVNLKVGDCEDLAWFVSKILLEIQKSQIVPALECFVITNCLVQAQAPQFKKNNGNVEIKEEPFKSKEEEKHIEELMDCYHMTCILFPVWEFSKMTENGKDKGKIQIQLPKLRGLEEKYQELKDVHLLVAEGTVCCYPDIFQSELIEATELDEIVNNLGGDEMRCIPIFENCKDRTGAIYGAIVEVITPFLIGKEHQIMTFFPCIHLGGSDYAAPLISHYKENCDSIFFLPGMDVTDVLNDEEFKKKKENELPLRCFKDDYFNMEGFKLEGGWIDQYLRVVQTRNKTEIKDPSVKGIYYKQLKRR